MNQRIKNRRKDFLHKLSTAYAKKIQYRICGKTSKAQLGKKPQTCKKYFGFRMGIFGNMLDYKTMKIEVPARNTTVDCSRCGYPVPKSLAARTHRCDVCGLVLDRDHNAAINILKNGLAIFNIELPQELREVTSVEISMRSVKQEEATGLSDSGSPINSRC